jgi:hypothetical protein
VSHLWDILERLLIWQMGIQGDGSGLDGDASLLLVFSRIGESTVEFVTGVFRLFLGGCTYASPAFAAEMIPARWTRESVRVDLP